MTGSSGNDIRECALEATDELIIRLLSVGARYSQKIGVSKPFPFILFSERGSNAVYSCAKTKRARTDCGTLRITLRVVCAEGCAGVRGSVGYRGIKRTAEFVVTSEVGQFWEDHERLYCRGAGEGRKRRSVISFPRGSEVGGGRSVELRYLRNRDQRFS